MFMYMLCVTFYSANENDNEFPDNETQNGELDIWNHNHAECDHDAFDDVDREKCLMRSNVTKLCPWSRGHLGWIYFGWGVKINSDEIDTNDAPSMKVFNQVLYLAYNNKRNNNNIYITKADNSLINGDIINTFDSWANGNPINNDNLSRAKETPVLCKFEGRLYCVWNDRVSEDLYISGAPSNNPQNGGWTERVLIKSSSNSNSTNNLFRTRKAPSLTVFNNRLYICWAAMTDRNRIYFSSIGSNPLTNDWDVPRVINDDDESKTDETPTILGPFQDLLFIVWKKDGNNNIFISGKRDPTSGNSWPDGMRINTESTSSSPVLKIIANRLFLFWRKMVGLTNRLYYSYTNDPLNSNAWSVGEEANLTDKPQTSVTIANYGDNRTLIGYENGGKIYVCQTTWKPFKRRRYVLSMYLFVENILKIYSVYVHQVLSSCVSWFFLCVDL